MGREELAKVAYHAYGSVTDFKNFRGEPMPEFDALPETIREAWCVASETVQKTVLDSSLTLKAVYDNPFADHEEAYFRRQIARQEREQASKE